MSLITRCPHCGTRFRVVPDQLKLADGWVRCGQCAEVFDAQLTIVTVPLPSEAAVLAEGDAATLPQPEQAPAPQPQPEPQPQPLPDEPWEREVMVFDEPEPTPAEGPPEGSGQESAPAGETVPGPVEPVLDFEIPDEDIAAAAAGAAAKAVSAEAGEDSLAPAEPEGSADPEHDQPPEDAPTFVRQAYQRAFWRRPEIRVLLVLLSLLLSLLIAGQLALQQRDFLAARVPALRPLLQALCKPLQCRVGLPQRIESIVIDGSSFTRLRPDAYRLSVTLSNQASTAVAMPALELTLTDTQDQPVLRRVLQAADLGPETPLAIAPSSEWSSTFTLAVATNAGTARIAGYRLLAFYP